MIRPLLQVTLTAHGSADKSHEVLLVRRRPTLLVVEHVDLLLEGVDRHRRHGGLLGVEDDDGRRTGGL